MTTLSAVIKKELKKAFPNVKFSVTTRNDDVSVKWELPLGTDATVAAVKAICQKHETIVHHGDLMNDTAWSSGSSVYENPSYTQERKDWALEQTKARNFAGATWNETHQRFEEADGRDAYHATKQYYEYLKNGVSCALINEYGGEPSEKFWYYERLKEEQAKLNLPAPQPEPEQVESEIEAPIVPTKIHAIESPIYIKAHLPSLNKNNTIEEYLEQPQGQIISAQISKVVELTPAEYERFLQSLLDDQEWLTDEGGNGSHYESKYGEDWIKLSNDDTEMKKWMAESYTICLLVTNGTDYILVDPQGYSYARYVAFGIDTTLNEVLELAHIELLSASVLPIAPETDKEKCVRVAKEIWPAMFKAEDVALCIEDGVASIALAAPAALETNLIPFPSPKQPELQPVAQPQSNDGDSFYLQSYQAWVNKLVARGEYGKIKSFDEWYAIAVEVM